MDNASPKILFIGLDRYAVDACIRAAIPAVLVSSASRLDDGLRRVPEELVVLPVDDQHNPEDVLMALTRAGFQGSDFGAVQTMDEWSLVAASLVGRQLGVPTIDPAVLLRFRDKSLQKEAVRNAGIPTAETIVIDDIHDVEGIAELPFSPAVLKPIAGAATANTSIVGSVEELRERSSSYRERDLDARTFILENHQSGEEWFADGILRDGDVLFCAVGRYGETCLNSLSQGWPMWLRHFDPVEEAWAYDRAMPLVDSALTALGLTDGPFHMEMFHDGETGAVTFSECAARTGGGLIHEQVQAKFGVNLSDLAVRIAMGMPYNISTEITHSVVGSTFLTGTGGILVSCPTPAEITALPGVVFARIERPLGARIAPGLSNTVQRIGQALVIADSLEEMEVRLAETREWFGEHLHVIPTGVKPHQLREVAASWYPDRDYRDTIWI